MNPTDEELLMKAQTPMCTFFVDGIPMPFYQMQDGRVLRPCILNNRVVWLTEKQFELYHPKPEMKVNNNKPWWKFFGVLAFVVLLSSCHHYPTTTEMRDNYKYNKTHKK